MTRTRALMLLRRKLLMSQKMLTKRHQVIANPHSAFSAQLFCCLSSGLHSRCRISHHCSLCLRLCQWQMRLTKMRGCCLADDEAQAEQPPAEAANGVAEKSSSDALQAFLDSSPDPFRARPPPSTKVCNIHPTVPSNPCVCNAAKARPAASHHAFTWTLDPLQSSAGCMRSPCTSAKLCRSMRRSET